MITQPRETGNNSHGCDADHPGQLRRVVHHEVVVRQVSLQPVAVHLLLVARAQHGGLLHPGDGQHGGTVELRVLQAVHARHLHWDGPTATPAKRRRAPRPGGLPVTRPQAAEFRRAFAGQWTVVSLPVSQQRVLERIESDLNGCEPRLVSMFAIFTRLTRNEGAPRTESLPSGISFRRPRPAARPRCRASAC